MQALELKMLVSKNKLKKAIELILSNDEISRNPNNVDLFNEIVTISRHYYALDEKKNELNFEQYNANANKISDSLLSFIDSLPEGLIFESLPASKNHQLLSIKIAESTENFDANDINRLIKQLSNIIGNKSEEFTITAIKNGSTILYILLPNNSAFKFIEHYNKNRQSKFYKDLKIESVEIKCIYFPSYAIYLFRILKGFFSKNRKFFFISSVSLLFFTFVAYSLYIEWYNKNLIYIMFNQKEDVVEEFSKLGNLISNSSDISENISDYIIESQDSIRKSASINSANLVSMLRQLDKNIELIGGQQKNINTALAKFEKLLNYFYSKVDRSSNNIELINKIKSDYSIIKNTVREQNSTIEIFKSKISLMITLVNVVEKNKNIDKSKKDEMIYAANSVLKGISMLGNINTISMKTM